MTFTREVRMSVRRGVGRCGWRSGVFPRCFRFGVCCFFFSSRRRHTRCSRDWSSDVCSSDLRGREHETRPLLIGTNGYDATATEMYFAFGLAAAERGYHCLLFDGPGQGKLLIEEGVPIRADWEHVVTPVVDLALGLDGVDHDGIALTGWSLG